MTLASFKSDLLVALQRYFPTARISITERRSIIFEVRANLDENTFIEVYYNALTQKESYTLISRGYRVFGYDNYKYWHVHPVESPSEHIECTRPSSEEVFKKTAEIFKGL